MEDSKPTGARATLTLRLIRSFEYRNIKYVVFKDVDLGQTAQQFLESVLSDIKKRPDVPPSFRNFLYDTMKIQHKPHGAKTNDPVVNTENDKHLILRAECSLQENGVENETEISFFKIEDYKKYQSCPVLRW